MICHWRSARPPGVSHDEQTVYLLIHYKERADGIRPPMKRRHFVDTKKGNAAYLSLLQEPEVEKVLPMTDLQYDELYLRRAGDEGA